MTFYSFIHGANPVKSISLACLGLNEALVELKWFGQCSAPSDMCGPAASRFNPFSLLAACTANGRLFVYHSQTRANGSNLFQTSSQTTRRVEFTSGDDAADREMANPDVALACDSAGKYSPSAVGYRERPFWLVAMVTISRLYVSN